MPQAILNIFVAVLIGGLIGAEREYREKSAGMRTLALVCLGSALFTMFSPLFPGDASPSRVASQIVSGIGFLGAGVILRERGHVSGLTTAATIWLTAALGVGVGLGQYLIAGAGTVVAIVVLWIFPRIEILSRAHDNYTYKIVAPFDETRYKQFSERFRAADLRVTRTTVAREGNEMTCRWEAYGRPEDHEAIRRQLLTEPNVIEFHIS